jgi:hypothetical protein
MGKHLVLAALAVGAISLAAAPTYASSTTHTPSTCGQGNSPPPTTCSSGSCSNSGGTSGQPGGTPQVGPGSANGAILDHFQCYGLLCNRRFQKRPVTLVDRYGTTSGVLCKLRSLCAPADKNGEDPSAVDHPGHLVEYGIHKNQHLDRIKDQTVTNQFGTVMVDLVARETLLVPSSVSGAFTGGGGGSADGAMVDGSANGAFPPHMTCYDVRSSSGFQFDGPRTVQVQDEFETVTIIAQKPWRLCVPTDKNGETPGIENSPDGLLCYRTKSKGGLGRPSVTFDNQFGSQSARVNQRRQFCVPSQIGGGGGSTTTTTTPSSTTTTTTTPGSPSGAFLGG